MSRRTQKSAPFFASHASERKQISHLIGLDNKLAYRQQTRTSFPVGSAFERASVMLSASTTVEINRGRAQLWSSALRTSANCGRELNHSWIQLNFSSVVERSTLVKKARKLLIQWDVRRACLAHTIGSKTESCFLYGWVRKKKRNRWHFCQSEAMPQRW